MAAEAEVTATRFVRTQARAEEGARPTLAAKGDVVSHQVFDVGFGFGPFDGLLASRTMSGARLNVDGELAQTELGRFGDVAFTDDAPQVNALFQAPGQVVATDSILFSPSWFFIKIRI